MVLGVLAAVIVLAILVAVVYLLIGLAKARRDLRDIQTRLAALHARVYAREQAAESPSTPSGADERPDAAPPPSSIAPNDPPAGLEPEPDTEAPAPAPTKDSATAAPPQPAAAKTDALTTAATVDATSPAKTSATSSATGGATGGAKAETPPGRADPGPPAAIVLREGNLNRLAAWLATNWFYVVSALSLALAGLYLVQYGIRAGLLQPPVRVLVALTFGTLMIIVGEVIRRRFGDDEDVTTAYLPSVFSGAGLVVLFGGILSARLLYDLIGAETALAGMVAVALVALVLGWFNGPLLAAVGIGGAYAAPFWVGGSSDDPSWLYGYFAVIAAVGLGIDTVRRWAWITVLTLVLAYPAGGLVVLGDGTTAGAFALYLAALLGMAILIPMRRLTPNHTGTMIAEAFAKTPGMAWPEFPARIAFATCGASVVGLAWVANEGSAEFWLATGLLTAVSALLIMASVRATALQDLALLPAIGLLWALAWQGDDRRAVFRAFRDAYADNPEADPPLAVTALLAMAGVISVFALGRALASRGAEMRFAVVWAGAAALIAPLAAILLELTWDPARVIGPYPWALHAAALAALMVIFAERLARVDGPEDRLRASLPVLSALSALAFAFTILFAETALTLAFVATVVAAAALDRAFRMPPMTVFISLGTATILYRLIADPGLAFALDGPLAEVIAVYGGALAGMLAALLLLRGLSRPTAQTVLESAAWSMGGLLLSVLLYRWLDSLSEGQTESHWAMGLFATIWLGLMAAQLHQLPLGGPLRLVRGALAAMFGFFGFSALAFALTLANPVQSPIAGDVLGPPVLNTLAVAYLLPALVLAGTVWQLKALDRQLRITGGVVAGAVAVFWVFVAIRHVWQGAAGMELENGIMQPELYSYTVALLLAGSLLFYQSLATGSPLLRRAGLVVLGLTVAKVYFVDAGGLTGLTRVFSFLLLGLALAGLAWLRRWAEERSMAARPAPSEGSSD
ncbi:MAG: DUF2339 domain-containing protein [Pseudomonadota bacterium]